MLYMACDTCMWHVTYDTWHIGDGEHCVKTSGPELLRFGSEDVLKTLRKRINDWLSESVSDKGVCRKKPATPGLLNMSQSTHHTCFPHWPWAPRPPWLYPDSPAPGQYRGTCWGNIHIIQELDWQAPVAHCQFPCANFNPFKVPALKLIQTVLIELVKQWNLVP